MKHVFTLLMIVLFANLSQAQNNDFDDLWKQVDQFETDGLPKSALEIVDQISIKAEADKNAPQQVKVLLFKSKFALSLEEDAQLKIISDFKSKISKSEFPTSHLLENILAKLYWQYFQQNRWRFYNRTNTAEKVDASDFRTWDLQTLFDEIHLHYQNSLKNGLLLQQEYLTQYDAIISKQDGSRIFRPTLFDLLAHNALEFYKSDENSITKPAYKFEIDDPAYLRDAVAFSQLRIESRDSSSLQLNALKIYQDLIQFHLKKGDPHALADVNIQRLLYTKEKASFEEKNELLINTLTIESERTSTHTVSGLYDYEIALIYSQQGSSYQPIRNESNQWKKADALKICESVLSKFPGSTAATKCNLLKQTIMNPSVQLSTEGFLPIEKNAKILVRYKNLDTLNFRVYKLTRNQLKRFENIYRKEEQLNFIKKLSVVTQWQSNLRNEKDYQIHSTEVLLPPLKNGYYLIFSSPDSNDESTFGFATIQITDLAVVDKSDASHLHYQLINRNNGQPIKNATITMRLERNGRVRQTEKAITNEKGEFKLKKIRDRYWSIGIEAEFRKELAFFDGFYASPFYGNSDSDGRDFEGFIFTDRSIYRPGQIVYFKGINIERKKGESKVVSGKAVTASLFDVNGQKISELNLETNDFGSFHGNFIIPNGGLTGEYYIQTSMVGMQDEHHYFSVEEYKRPKFEAKFNPVTETIRLNDSVTIKGNAMAYAGPQITDAKVVYRVHRKVQFPRWYYWYHPWFNSEPQEITHGETKTDSEGNFEISFNALPDLSVDKTSLPIFHYEITADITDINGETRSASTVINVGYHAMKLAISVDPKLDKQSKDHKITIDSKNLNNEFVPA
ncbi:MAG: alpha-2-macroglobulin, partial [Bacteroidia bacterium]|nr:alpha-2-macroglobulin [Bacteroidia bacterium]